MADRKEVIRKITGLMQSEGISPDELKEPGEEMKQQLAPRMQRPQPRPRRRQNRGMITSGNIVGGGPVLQAQKGIFDDKQPIISGGRKITDGPILSGNRKPVVGNRGRPVSRGSIIGNRRIIGDGREIGDRIFGRRRK